jgi:hypothetical protein
VGEARPVKLKIASDNAIVRRSKELRDAGTRFATEIGGDLNSLAHMNDDHRDTMMLYASITSGQCGELALFGPNLEGLEIQSDARRALIFRNAADALQKIFGRNRSITRGR